MAMAAKGVDYVSGTFTVPNDATTYTLEFGKTFSKYMYLVEMTDESFATLSATGINNNKTFRTYGVYPLKITENNTNTNIRLNPSTGVINGSFNPIPATWSEASIIFESRALDGGAYYIYRGYTYNYYIISLDNL